MGNVAVSSAAPLPLGWAGARAGGLRLGAPGSGRPKAKGEEGPPRIEGGEVGSWRLFGITIGAQLRPGPRQ